MTQPTMPEVQAALPWALGYSPAFEAAKSEGAGDFSTMEHLDFTHALLHVVKATGKLAAMSENADHGRRESLDYVTGTRTNSDLPLTDFPHADVEKLTADLVICAMRLANVRPGGSFDLWAAVLRRIDDKNGTRLSGGAS